MSDVARWTRVGTLAAFALLLGYVETFIPIPIPGVKLGLANMAVLAELGLGDISGAACIACIKVLASGFLFGSPLTMVYSAAGTLLAFLGMALLSRLRTMRLWMVSVVGALLHEIGQLFVAQAVLQTDVVWYMLPMLMVAGCVTGALCGTLAESLRASLPTEEEFSSVRVDMARLEPQAPQPRALVVFVCLAAFAVVVLHLSSISALAACAAFSLAACLVAGVGVRALLRMLPLLAGVFALTFALQLVASTTDVAGVAQEAFRATARLASLALSSTAFAHALMRNGGTLTTSPARIAPTDGEEHEAGGTSAEHNTSAAPEAYRIAGASEGRWADGASAEHNTSAAPEAYRVAGASDECATNGASGEHRDKDESVKQCANSASGERWADDTSGKQRANDTPADDLTKTVAWLVAPLEKFGVRTQGFVLAFDVALRLVPVLGAIIDKEHLSLRTLRQRLPSLVRDVCLRAANLG